MNQSYNSFLRRLLLLLLMSAGALTAQVTVSGSTGADGTYATLKDAFDSLNVYGNQSGNVISISITASITGSASASLNQPSVSSWTSLTISPSGGALRTLSGSVNGGALINLNGADNVVIDGLNSGGNALTIENTDSSNTAGTSTIRFINDASNNTVQNCTIIGSSKLTTSGTIFFSTGSTTGNDNNTVTGNTIAANDSTPYNGIYSAGTSVAVDNSGISVTNNNIQDYHGVIAASNGILVASNSSAWTITGNKFFQSAARTTTAGSNTHRAIQIVTALGVNYTVSNNIIGYANAGGTGVTTYNGAFGNLFRAIEMTVGTSSASSVQNNTITGISFSTTSGTGTGAGIFAGISILAGNVNVGTSSGNTIGAATGTGAISITSTTSLGLISGIYATSTGTVDIQNNTIGSVSTGGTALIGYTFNGISTAGALGNITIASNTIGSTVTAHSIAVGTNGVTTTPVCTFTGITNTATGTISITGNTVQNVTVYGTGASVFNGILNSGGSGTLAITSNNIIAGTLTGTGAFQPILTSAAVTTLNMNNNIIRSNSRTATTGAFTAISNSGAVTSAITINNNQLGNGSGGLVTYSAANSSALTGISNSGGTASAALAITGNDIRGITHSVAGSSAHTYIVNSAATLTQNINANTFTNLTVNTTGSVTFISMTNGLSASGVQTVDTNAIVTAFSKTGAGGTVTFISGTGTSAQGSIIRNRANKFSSVTVTGATAITGILNSNTSLDKTFSQDTLSSWTGGSAAVIAMSITAGSSTITLNRITDITTATAAAATITAISSGATESISITDNTISNLVTGSAAFINSFTGITNAAGNGVTITGNTITGCTAGGTAASIFTGITTITAGSGTLTVTGNSIISGTNAGTGAFTGISNAVAFTSATISNNIIRSNSRSTATGTFTAITNSAAVTSAININNNQLGNGSGGLVTYSAANSSALTGISNSGGTSSAALVITGNDIRGITHSVAGSSAHTYIVNSAATLTQNINANTFTNLTVNTTGSVTFISMTNGLSASGVQTVDTNAIVTAFSKTGAGGTVTFISGTGTSAQGSIIRNRANKFSSVTVTGATAITGILNSNTSLDKTFSQDTLSSWTGGSAAVIAMSITAGSSTITLNRITDITTATAAAATITAISSGATESISITDNTISNLVTGSAAFINSFTGITNAAGNGVTITGNTITGCTAGGTAASIFTGITTITAGSGTLTVTGNSIISGTNAGTGAFTGISNAVAFTSATISSNIIRNSTVATVTGPFTAIANSGAVTSSITINNNQLGNGSGGLVTYSAANSSALTGISNSGGTVSAALVITGNDIRGITHSVAGSSAHTYIINSAATLTQNISSNTFTNLDVNTTGAIIMISNNVAVSGSGTQDVNSNSIVTAFVRNAASASGALTLFTSAASSLSGSVINNNSNNFSNITVSGAATIAGWVSTDAGSSTKTVQNNTFSNWTGGTGAITVLSLSGNSNTTTGNAVNTISSAGTITGITSGAGNDNIYLNTVHTLVSTGATATTVTGITVTAGTTKSLYRNTIYNLQANNITTGSVQGLLVSSGTTNHIYRNKIYDLSSSSAGITTGTVNGMVISGATASMVTNISNNLIGTLTATAASSTNAVIGISLTATGVTSNINVYYNTVYLNASSSGGNFGTSGILHTSNATSTTAALDLRNNVIVNTSTPAGTGTTVAFRRSAATLSNFVTTSNNNLFYAGTPGAVNLIYSTGDQQTLAGYKTAVLPRDAGSVTESPTWISTTGSSANFLQADSTIASQIESGGAAIASYDIDYDGGIRQGSGGYAGTGTAPDIGAYESEGIPNNLNAPSILYTILTNTASTANRTFSATITDGTGVNTSVGFKPRVWYKKSTNANVLPGTNDNTTDGWKYVETSGSSSPFTFTIDHGLISGGVSSGDIIQYFVIAENTLLTPLVGINSGIFASTPAGVALTGAAFPISGTINSYTILAGLSGTVNVGAGETYTTLTGAAGLFADINLKGLAGNLTANITGNLTETGANGLNAIIYGGDVTYTLTISPSGGAMRTVSGTIAGGPVINLNGADNVVIDGLNSGGNGLTIENTSASATAGTSTIRFINDASNNTVQNCTIIGSSKLTTSGTIFFSTGTTTGNDSNTVTGNTIAANDSTPYNAVYSAGTSVAVDNSGISVTNNDIQDYHGVIAASNGILVASNSSAWTITGNKFFQSATRTTTAGSNIHRAIQIVTALGTGYTVSNNIIGYANAGGTGVTTYDGAFGNLFRAIEMTVGTASSSSIQGNTISGISFLTTSGTTTVPGIFSGIYIVAGNVNIGTSSGNTIGAATGNGAISITSTTSLGLITGIYATTIGTADIQNNTIGSVSTGGTALIGYTFNGISTAGALGNITIASNTIGSTVTAHSIAVGTNGVTTTPVCTFTGITNTATGTISITDNTVQNVTAYGTGASVFNGILNSGGNGTLAMSSNNVISGTITGTGAFTGMANSAIVATLNMNSNTIRSNSRTATTGAFTAISNSGAVTSAITINNNQLGNGSGGLVTYSAANSSALTGISNSGGTASAALVITGNDIRGITHSVAGSSAHTYIVNSAATLTQNINANTFTNLTVNTTGSVTFISMTNGLSASGVQTVDTNAIVTAFSKTGAGGTVTFISGTGTSAQGSIIRIRANKFSSVTVTGATAITGILNSNTSLDKTFSQDTLSSWTGGSAAVIAMSITAGSSTITLNRITDITTATAAAATITAISSGATESISITDNTISNLVTGSAAFINSFTGITNAAGNGVTITGNTITGCTAGGTAASIFTGITTITAGSGTLTVTGNSIISGTNAGTGAFIGISNAVAFTSATISNNIIRSNSRTATTGAFTAISNSGAVTSTITINNNQLGNGSGGLVTYSAANSSALTGISNSGGTASAALVITGNDIRGITHSVAGSSAHTYIINSAATLTQNISSNTFTNLDVNTTGAIIMISNSVAVSGSGTQDVNSNSIVTAFVRNAASASGALTLFTSAASSLTGSVINNNSNNFSNITVSGAATIAGWVSTDAGSSTKTVQNNTFSNWTGGTGAITVLSLSGNSNTTTGNAINTITSAGSITGVTSGAGNDNIYLNTVHTLVSTGTVATTVTGMAVTAGTTKSVYRNTVYNLQANNISTGSVIGISVSSGTTNHLYRNKVYDLSSSSNGITTGSVNGIQISGATASMVTNLSNNLIGDLRATAASATNAVIGISLTATGVTSNINVYYNTVYLNASSSGGNFGTSGILHTSNATSTTAALDLRNNVIVNTSTPAGTGLTVAYRRSLGSAGRLANYASTSNRNLFYAGTPGTTRLIYNDGTSSAQTLAAYKAGVFTAGTVAPRDAGSVTESPTWISTTGSNANFLQADSTIASQIESGGAAIASYDIDYNSGIRQGSGGYTGTGTAPDIGAYESEGVPPANYYSKSTGNLHILANWGTSTDGTGTPPVNFTSNGTIFYVRNNATPTIGAAWIVSGSGSKIVVGDGTAACNFTIPSSFTVTGTIDIENNATLTIQNTVNPTFGDVAPGSTVNYNASTGGQTIVGLDYFNLTISNTSGVNTLTGTVGIANVYSPSAGALTSAGTSTVDFNNATGGQTIPASEYYNLTISNSSGVNTLAGTIQVLNTFSPSADPLTAAGTSTVEYSNATGGQSIAEFNYYNLTSSNSSGVNTLIGTIGISNTFTPAAGALTSFGTSTVDFNNAAGGQTVPAFNYYDLTVSNTSGVTTLNGSIGVRNTFTPSPGGLTSAGTSTVTFNNTTGGQTVPSFDYHSVTMSNSSGVTTLSGTVGVSSSFTPSAGALTSAGTSTVNYNGTGAQDVSLFAYDNLTISGAGTSSLTASVTVAGDLSITGGTFDLTSFTANRGSAGGTLTIAALCTLRIGGVGTTIPSNFTTLAFDASSKVEYYGTGQTIPAGTYDNLNVAGSGTTITLSSNVSITGDLIITNGTLDLAAFTANRNSSGGTLNIGSGGTLRIAGTNALPLNYGTVSFDPASTVEYYGTSHTITEANYGNLVVTSSGAITLPAGTVGIASAFTPGTGTYTVAGSTISYNGTGGQTVASFGYHDLTLATSGTKTFASGTTSVAGALTLSGASADATTNSSTIEYNGSSAQTIAAITYHNLTFTNAGIKSILGSVTVDQDVLANTGTVIVIDASGTLVIHGDLDNSGILTNDGTLNLVP